MDPELESLESKRRLLFWVSNGAGLLLLASLLIGFLIGLPILFFITLVLVSPFVLWYISQLGRFRSSVEKVIHASVAKKLGASYNPEERLSWPELQKAGLFPTPDHLFSSGSLEVPVGEFRVRGHNVAIQKIEKVQERDGKERTVYVTVFHGMVYQIPLPWEGPEFALASRELLPSAYLTRKDFKEVALEDPEFNKMFYLAGRDQVETRKVFTPAFMEKIKAVRKRMRPFLLSSTRGELFLAVPWKRWFDVDIDKDVLSLREEIEKEMREEIAFAKVLLEDLGLAKEARRRGLGKGG